MTESAASAMQTQTPPFSQRPGAPGRGTISSQVCEFLMQRGGDVRAHTHPHEHENTNAH